MVASNLQSKKIRFVYDTSFAPLSFDIVYSLAICRALSEYHSLQKKIDLFVISDSFRDVGIESQYGDQYSVQKLRDTVLSVLPLNRWIENYGLYRRRISLPRDPQCLIFHHWRLKQEGRA